MGHASALKLAFDLMYFPSNVSFVRSAPLPDDVLMLLRIAAGDENAITKGAELAGRPRDVVREASAFFVEQVLLYPEADSYRVLGAKPDAPYSELRRNMAILLRWLHPDRDRNCERSVFAARVTRAWDNLKTKERRAAYDRARRSSETDKSPTWHRGRMRSPGSNSRQRRANQERHGATFGRNHESAYLQQRSWLLNRIRMLLFGRTAP